MSNQRDSDKVYVGVWLHNTHLAALDKERKMVNMSGMPGVMDRSTYIKCALAEKLMRIGHSLDIRFCFPKDRTQTNEPQPKVVLVNDWSI